MEFLLSLAAQIPLVVIFVWFQLEQDKRQIDSESKRDAEWRAFLKEQRQESTKALETMSKNLEKLSKLVEAHDQRLEVAIARMEERTQNIS